MKEKLSLLSELIKLAQCDNKVRKKEYDFLLTIAKSLNVSIEDFDQLFEKYIIRKFTLRQHFHKLSPNKRHGHGMRF